MLAYFLIFLTKVSFDITGNVCIQGLCKEFFAFFFGSALSRLVYPASTSARALSMSWSCNRSMFRYRFDPHWVPAT
jgi:hypothetical protein